VSNLSRRSLVTSAAVLPALAVPAVAIASIPADDDTLARIEQHKTGALRENRGCERMSALERTIPDELRRQFYISDRGTEVGKDDDPRWTTAQAEYWAAVDEKDAIAWSFVDRPPTTAAGVTAILAYADEHEAAGHEWPDSRHYFTAIGTYDRLVEEDWRASLVKAIALMLQRLAVQS
jgi:hypothetical protein